MKKNSKRNKRIRNLVLICVMSALLLTVGTYAWFIGMQTVKVNSFEVKIAGVDSLMLSMDGKSWSTAIDVTDEETYPAYAKNANEFLKDSKEGLKPISTNGVFDTDASRLKLFEKGSLTATTGGYRLMASQVDNVTTQVSDGTEYVEGDGYVAFDLFVMNLSGDAYYPEISTPSNEEAIYLTYESKVTAGTTGNTSAGIENSVRVAFGQIGRVSASAFYPLGDDDTDKWNTVTGMTCAGSKDTQDKVVVTGICRDAAIWEPNENTHTAAAKKWYETTCKARKAATGENKSFSYETEESKKDCSALTGTLLKQVDTFTDTEKLKSGVDREEIFTLAPNSITKIRVYIWIEGQDIDNYDFASLGYSISVNFGFTKERITSGEIDEDMDLTDTPSGDVTDKIEQLPEAGA